MEGGREEKRKIETEIQKQADRNRQRQMTDTQKEERRQTKQATVRHLRKNRD